jgi:hypothetical protein
MVPSQAKNHDVSAKSAAVTAKKKESQKDKDKDKQRERESGGKEGHEELGCGGSLG